MMKGLLILGAIYISWLLLLWSSQRKIIYPYYAISEPTATPKSKVTFEQVWIDIEENQAVEGWFFRASMEKDSSLPAVIYFHGNAELIDHNLAVAEQYLKLGYHVLMPEYRGYGRSGGAPSQEAIVKDMENFRGWLTDHPDVNQSRLIYHGRSLGGGVACALAALSPPKALILESTFSSMGAMARRYFAPSFLLKDLYPNAQILANLEVPTLILHGKGDLTIPLQHGRDLSRFVPPERFIIFDADHNEPLPPTVWQGVATFLDRVVQRTP